MKNLAIYGAYVVLLLYELNVEGNRMQSFVEEMSWKVASLKTDV
jgi:hypothetical protein